MNFITNTNAPDRKKLVKALAEHFDFDATYAGPAHLRLQGRRHHRRARRPARHRG